MNKDLYLVRHGQTIFNLKRIIQGWSDSPLTQLGCDQAARAGMFLRARGIEPDHAYTSTLHRTEQTIANLWPGLAYERLDGLRETLRARTLRAIAEEHDKPVTHVSINWVSQQKGMTCALTGSKNVDQAIMNAAAGDWDLSAEELARIDAAYDRIFRE